MLVLIMGDFRIFFISLHFSKNPKTSAMDNIIAKFVRTSPIRGEHTYESITELQKTLYANAATLPSHSGGGKNGHLGLIMSTTLYRTLSNIPYVIPIPHPPAPDYSGANTGEMRSKIKDNNEIKDK